MKDKVALSELRGNLVPFKASRVESDFIWCSADAEERAELQEACSYLISESASASVKQFYAERYGGSGIQRNGGGARCGFDGHYQVKGIGANPLVGDGSDTRHSDGRLSVAHAIYEIIWSEILAQVLPFGAVRTKAVLLVRPSEEQASGRISNAEKRALLVREPVVRPAHFERAPYFRPQSRYAGLLIHDAERVSRVISQLSDNLPLPAGRERQNAALNHEKNCLEGLCELARRQAIQMAWCRTRFLRLTTSPSNIATDGRLLDFNGLSSLYPDTDYRDFGYQVRRIELWKEPAVLVQGLTDLCLYLGKYQFSPAFTEMAQQQVKETFQRTFTDACYRGYLDMLGIRQDNLPLTPVLKGLVNIFTSLLEHPFGMPQTAASSSDSTGSVKTSVLELIRIAQGINTGHRARFMQDKRFHPMLEHMKTSLSWLNAQGMSGHQMEAAAEQRLGTRERLNKIAMFAHIAKVLDDSGSSTDALSAEITQITQEYAKYAISVLGQMPSAAFLLSGGKSL